jgi:hypothetical protein
VVLYGLSSFHIHSTRSPDLVTSFHVQAIRQNGEMIYLEGEKAELIVSQTTLLQPFDFISILIELLDLNCIPVGGDLELFDTFSGAKEIPKTFSNDAMPVLTFEINDDKLHQDMTTPQVKVIPPSWAHMGSA